MFLAFIVLIFIFRSRFSVREINQKVKILLKRFDQIGLQEA